MNESASSSKPSPLPCPPALAVQAARVLIVDDEPTTVEVVARQLREMGFGHVAVCTDSRRALALVAAERPDVVLLDILMPDVSGLEVLRELRAAAATAHLPVIILTMVEDFQTKVQALESGATDFLSKPVDFVELAPRIRNALVVKRYHDALADHARELQQQVDSQTASLRESHAALERANFVLRRSCAAAETAARAKSQFLANMSHEVRTPLTAIIGFAEELLSGAGCSAVAKPCEDVLQIVLRNGRHLLEIVNDVLDVAKIEKGRLRIERTACSPRAVLGEVERLLGPEATSKGLAFAVEIGASVPEAIHCDPTRLRQILTNLVGNAVKFTPRGSVRILARMVQEDGPAPLMQFEVIDTGIGIDPDQTEEIFLPFTQARTAGGDRYPGTGLGLTICKYLVEELGGRIDVESRPGHGSTFRFAVATQAPDASPASVAQRPAAGRRAAPDASAAPSCGPLRVLVAEDSPDNQRLIRLMLEKAGADVSVVPDGRAALHAALAAWREDRPFDVVLTDIQMPGIDGYGLTERLRAEGYPGRIIALTANVMRGEREKCLAAGFDDYLSKPIDRAELVRLVWAVTSPKSVVALA